MLVWKNVKHWKYRCRDCAVQTADFGRVRGADSPASRPGARNTPGDGDTLYRASIELDGDIAEEVDLNRALSVDDHVSTRRKEVAGRPGGHSTWMHTRLRPGEDDGIEEMVQRIREIADELDELEL